MLPCRIALLRRKSGMNQLQLAEKLHLSPSTIGMYEQGRRTPNVDILVQMAQLFNVSLGYLITGSEFTPSSENRGAYNTPSPSTCHNCCCQKLIDLIRENATPGKHEQP